jgi:hypothetical protein
MSGTAGLPSPRSVDCFRIGHECWDVCIGIGVDCAAARASDAQLHWKPLGKLRQVTGGVGKLFCCPDMVRPLNPHDPRTHQTVPAHTSA